MRLSIFPPVILRESRSSPARNRVVIETRSSRMCTFRPRDPAQACLHTLVPCLIVGLGCFSFCLAVPICFWGHTHWEDPARNWLYRGVTALLHEHLVPSGVPMPGYPGSRAVIYSLAGAGGNAIFVAQESVDPATCILSAPVDLGARSRIRPRLRAFLGLVSPQMTVSLYGHRLYVLCPFPFLFPFLCPYRDHRPHSCSLPLPGPPVRRHR
jgi:hypothetical protein